MEKSNLEYKPELLNASDLAKYEALQTIAQQLELILPENTSLKKQFELLTQRIDQLITADFNKLLRVLYRIDVYEEKIRKALAHTSDVPSAQVISYLLIERELEKVKWRNLYR